jgi:hypothetical protein
VKDPKIAEAAADPTSASRVLIKGLAAGGTQLELTGANGTTVTVTVRVP